MAAQDAINERVAKKEKASIELTKGLAREFLRIVSQSMRVHERRRASLRRLLLRVWHGWHEDIKEGMSVSMRELTLRAMLQVPGKRLHWRGTISSAKYGTDCASHTKSVCQFCEVLGHSI